MKLFRLAWLVEYAFVCLLGRVWCVPSAYRAFAASARVARPAKDAERAAFAPSRGFGRDVVGCKFTRTGNPVRRPFVALTFQPVPLDVLLDELLASDACFV